MISEALKSPELARVTLPYRFDLLKIKEGDDKTLVLSGVDSKAVFFLTQADRLQGIRSFFAENAKSVKTLKLETLEGYVFTLYLDLSSVSADRY